VRRSIRRRLTLGLAFQHAETHPHGQTRMPLDRELADSQLCKGQALARARRTSTSSCAPRLATCSPRAAANHWLFRARVSWCVRLEQCSFESWLTFSLSQAAITGPEKPVALAQPPTAMCLEPGHRHRSLASSLAHASIESCSLVDEKCA
jgi:hypothetical protein